MITWLVGLSGSGKTTIGRLVYEKLKAKQTNTVFVDGDEIRALFKHEGKKIIQLSKEGGMPSESMKFACG